MKRRLMTFQNDRTVEPHPGAGTRRCAGRSIMPARRKFTKQARVNDKR